ncbi:MAG: hypothetical protein JST92_26350, partial [Deltaproteobacteria bacterium]|nr:hypothetical protein [Deltaproteobacteria bacterium]
TTGYELDKDGKPGDLLEFKQELSWVNGKLTHGKTLSRTYAGKPFPEQDMKKADEEEDKKRRQAELREKDGEADPGKPMFTAFRPPLHTFKLLGEEQVAGRRAYKLEVTPRPEARENGRVGTAWIDAQTFVPLKGIYSPNPLPSSVDSMELEEDFVPGPQGESVPSLSRTKAKGGFWFMKKNVVLEQRYEGCK